MIQEFVERFQANPITWNEHPASYQDIVKKVVEVLTTNEYDSLDPNRIHSIDDGDYQGTLLFIIAGIGYQPNDYWFVKVNYGSCSGCDTLEAIRGYSDEPVTPEQAKDYNTLALHIVQGLTAMQ